MSKKNTHNKDKKPVGSKKTKLNKEALLNITPSKLQDVIEQLIDRLEILESKSK